MTRWVAVLLLLTGCAVGPDYEAPELNLPEAYRGGDEDGASRESIAAVEWQSVFADPTLQTLIEQGLENNLDLAAARARLREAEAALTIARAPLYPSFDVGLKTERESESSLTNDPATLEDTISLLGMFSWELDLWGFNRRSAEASAAEVDVYERAVHAQQVSLIGAIAATYFNLVAVEQQYKLTEVTIGTREETLKISTLRNESGVISGLEVAQARVALAQAEQQLPVLRNNQFVLENELRRLIGEPPGSVALTGGLKQFSGTDMLPSGMPSELLLRRPDVLLAEAEMVAANARVGVATANLFPRFQLTSSVGTESNELSDILDSDASTWIAALNIVQPVFASGSRRANVEASKARYEQAVLKYRAVVLNALGDVSNALDAQKGARDEAVVTRRLRDASNEYLRLAGLRYMNGVVGYIDVLDAQRQYFEAQLSLIEAIRDEYLALAFLYRALGGGWVADD